METTTAAINPQDVSDELTVDPTVAMADVQNSVDDLQYASDALKADPIVIMFAVYGKVFFSEGGGSKIN